MKCPYCDGKGYYYQESSYGMELVQCNCQNKMTNEEWLHTLTTEQLTEFLFGIAYMCSYCGDEAHSTKEKTQQCHFGKCGCQRKDWVEWLKQPHTKGEAK